MSKKAFVNEILVVTKILGKLLVNPGKIDEKLGELNKSCWTIDSETFAISGIRWSLLDLCNAELLNVTGLPQLGTLGAGNHYAEIQVVDEIFDKFAASRMGIDRVGQVVVMIHCGSRGFGHQVGSNKFNACSKTCIFKRKVRQRD